MNKLILLFAGGGTGTLLRYALSLWTNKTVDSDFPYGTLAVNLTGCMIIGMLAGLNEKTFFQEDMKLLLFTGLLGGFTTFSSFSVETLNLFRMGQAYQAIAYILTSTFGGILLAAAGFFLLKSKS
jgi:CrcB protein